MFSHLRGPIERGWVSFWTANVDPRIIKDLFTEVPLFLRALRRALGVPDLEHLGPSDPFYPDSGPEAINHIQEILRSYKLSVQTGRTCLVSEDARLTAIAEVFYQYFARIDDGAAAWQPRWPVFSDEL
jgi:hypothetical protein